MLKIFTLRTVDRRDRAGPMIAGHQGYVLIQTDNYNIETSVTGLEVDHPDPRHGGAVRH